MADPGQLSGWIVTLGTSIDTLANNYITTNVSSVTTALTPVVAVLVTIWWILFGFAIIRGEAQGGVVSALWKMMKVTMIISLALNVGSYNDFIVNGYDGLRDGVASSFQTSDGITVGDFQNADGNTGNIWSVLDKAESVYDGLINEAVQGTKFYDVLSAIAMTFMDIGFTVVLMVALYLAIITKLFATFFLALGPLFILCLLFEPTKRFFDGWLGMLLNTIVLTWIGIFAISFSLHCINLLVGQLIGQWSVLVNPITTAVQILALCLVLALLIYQSPSWAAALTGGTSLQMGERMVRDMVALARNPNKNGADNNTNNTIQQTSRYERMKAAMHRGLQGGSTAVGSAAGRAASYARAAMRGRGN